MTNRPSMAWMPAVSVAAVLALLVPMAALAVPGATAAVLAPLKALEAGGARVGAAFSVDGREVAALHGDALLNPASVTKLFTAALAVQALGVDRTFPTTVSAVGTGPRVDLLVVVPGGDPTLGAADLEALARCVRDKGVTAAGDLVVDTGPFTDESEPPAYDRKDTLAPYRAGVAALQVDRGAVTVTVTSGAPGAPPRVSLSSASDRVVVINEAITAGKGSTQAKSKRASGRLDLAGRVDKDGRLVLRLTGVLKSKKPILQTFRVPDPGGHAAGAFRVALEAAGVDVGGGPPVAAAPAGSRVLCTRGGTTLRAILVPMLKDSINPIAEAVLRLVGAQAAGDRPAGFMEGPKALSDFLRDRVGAPKDGFRFANGSGLYDANAVSARTAVALLHWLRGTPVGASVLDALPVAGVDGTLRKRLKGTPLSGRLRAKTGTLDDAVTLAGLVALPGGHVAEFAVLVNAAECKVPAKGQASRCPALDRSAARKATDEALVLLWKAYARAPSPSPRRARPPEPRRPPVPGLRCVQPAARARRREGLAPAGAPRPGSS